MKIFSIAGLVVALLAASYSAELTTVRNADNSVACTLSGTYANGTNVTSCSTLEISSLTVPAGVTLDLRKVKTGAKITFTGNTTFGTQLWDGPLVYLSGKNLDVSGDGVLDGQGAWYWAQGQKVTRPVFFRMWKVINSTVSSFNLLNTPYRTFSILNSNNTVVSGLTLDASAGDGLAKNTDGFDLSQNNGVTIKNCKVHNQDDCLAMQSSYNTVFSGNSCTGGHGISIGSLGGAAADYTTTVSGLLVKNNKIINNDNGIRIKTIIGLQGLVTNAVYTNNVLTNVKNAIVIHSDYNKTKGGYSGLPNSMVPINHITIKGLTGTATNKWDIVANPDVVSDWSFSGIDISATSLGSCSGEPSSLTCE